MPNLQRLHGHGYDLVIDVDKGASLLSLSWTRPDGRPFEVLHPCPPALPAQNVGSFVMAPFTNRIDQGRFDLADRTVRLPQNRPADALAIHGFSRDRAWQVLEATERTICLIDRADSNPAPFAYSLIQTVTIGPAGVDLRLALTNEAQERLPYGFGFHPWFHKEPQTHLSFIAETAFGRDGRGFAQDPAPFAERDRFAAGIDVAALPWFDAHFSGWNARSAVIEWRATGVRMVLSATGALGNLHVYVPDDRPVLCVEPVSHVPDVHNRRAYAGFGDLTWLDPRETMTGSMRLSLRTA